MNKYLLYVQWKVKKLQASLSNEEYYIIKDSINVVIPVWIWGQAGLSSNPISPASFLCGTSV